MKNERGEIERGREIEEKNMKKVSTRYTEAMKRSNSEVTRNEKGRCNKQLFPRGKEKEGEEEEEEAKKKSKSRLNI